MGDGTLRGAAVLVLDETQSRRIELSFLFAMLKRELARRGDTFRLVLMSAVDEEDVMRAHFGSDLGAVKVSGRRFVVERYELRACPPCKDVDAGIFRRVEVLARREMSLSDGVLLIFVKGKWEIEELIKKLGTSGWRCLPFHAELDKPDMILYSSCRRMPLKW